MERANVGGAVAAVRAAAAAGVPRLVHTSSAATIGEPPGTIGTEWTPPPRLVSVDLRADQDRGRATRRSQAARETGPGPRLRQPVLGPGPRPGRWHRPLPAAFLDGRLKVFVDTQREPRRHRRLRRPGHLLAAERGVAGERYLLSTGSALTITEALSLAAEVAGVDAQAAAGCRARSRRSAGAVRRARLQSCAGKPPAGLPRDGPHAAARPPLRRLARRARARPALHDPRETLRKTIEWARAEGLIR